MMDKNAAHIAALIGVVGLQQEEIETLKSQVSQLTELVMKLSSKGITVTETVTETRTVTREIKVNEEVQHQEVIVEKREPKTAQYTFVHVPTSSTGRIRWKNHELSEEAVCLQVLYELHELNGVDIRTGANLDPSLYTAIKNRFKGEKWGAIVEQANRLALK